MDALSIFNETTLHIRKSQVASVCMKQIKFLSGEVAFAPHVRRFHRYFQINKFYNYAEETKYKMVLHTNCTDFRGS